MNRRTVTYEELGITPARLRELRYFCNQYQEWKDKLDIIYPSAKGQQLDGMPYSKTNNVSDETSDMAIKRTMLMEKIKMIEDSAKEASPDSWQYIIKSVCYREKYRYLKSILGMPLSEASFRDRVKIFFGILHKKRK